MMSNGASRRLYRKVAKTGAPSCTKAQPTTRLHPQHTGKSQKQSATYPIHIISNNRIHFSTNYSTPQKAAFEHTLALQCKTALMQYYILPTAQRQSCEKSRICTKETDALRVKRKLQIKIIPHIKYCTPTTCPP